MMCGSGHYHVKYTKQNTNYAFYSIYIVLMGRINSQNPLAGLKDIIS